MKSTKVLSIVVTVVVILASSLAIANPPGLVIGGVDGDMSQSMKNFSMTTPDFSIDATKGTQWGDGSGFIFGGPKDKVSLKMMEKQEVLHFQEQSSPDYSFAIGGKVEQDLEISGLLKRWGHFDLDAFSKEKTLILLGHDGNAMESIIKSDTLEKMDGKISGLGKISGSLSTEKYEGYFQEFINPDSYSLHYGQLNESVSLDGFAQGTKSCGPSSGEFSGMAFTNTTGITKTDSVVTPTLNSANASESVRSTAGIVDGKGTTAEIDVKMVTGYKQSSGNSTSLINQSGSSSLKIEITKKPLR